MATEEYGKVGSKGELYPSIKIRKMLKLQPNNRVKYTVTSKGYLIVEKVYTIEELLKQPMTAKVSVEEIEKLSEQMQNQGYVDED